MAEQFEESSLSQDDNTSQLRREVSLNSALLGEIVSDDDKFTEKLTTLNQAGVSHLHREEYEVALVYLQEGEKILEYAASCGKTIDRSIIISTLQNEACVYQRLWDLEKASNYLEAIIFNMNAYLECSGEVSIDSQIFDIHSASCRELGKLIKKRTAMAFYYLQFSAISSQLKKHQTALGSAFKALSILKLVCQECYSFERFLRRDEKHQEGVSVILKELGCLKETVELDKVDKYLIQARKGILKLKARGQKDKSLDGIANFAIGSVMQISPSRVEDLLREPRMRDQVGLIQKINKAIYISICCFTIATQLRLIAAENYQDSQVEGSLEYRKSKLFHLNSIILISKYAPCDTKYLDHIIKSFNAHYKIDLNSEQSFQKHGNGQMHSNGSVEKLHSNGSVEKQGCSVQVSSWKGKAEEAHEIESPVVRFNTNKHDMTTKVPTQTQNSEKSIEQKHRSPSFELKRRKKHSKIHLEPRKEKHLQSEASREGDNEMLGRTFVKSPYFGQGNRKSSINKKSSQDKLTLLMPARSSRSNRQLKEREVKKREKSRDRSSQQKVSLDNVGKSRERVQKKRKKKLEEEYMIKPGKKTSNKLKAAISLKSLKKEEPVKRKGEELSSSKQLGNGGLSPHGNTFIGPKKSGIKKVKP